MISARPWTSSVCAAIILAAVSAACAKGKEAPAAGAGAAATSAVGGAASSSTDLGGTRIHLQIVGGAHAGTFDQEMGTAGCVAGAAGPGSWHLMWGGGDPGDPNSLNSVTLDVPAAAGNGTTPFTLQVFLGSGDDTSGVVVNTLAASGGLAGKGTVTVADRGPRATVTFDATTATGVRLQGTFDCPVVLRQ